MLQVKITKKLMILTTLSCLFGQAHATQYPIEATMIKPDMQLENKDYQVDHIDTDNYLGTLTCTNGNKAKMYNKKDIYIGENGWDAKAFIRLSIMGDIVAKAIESDALFIGGNTSLPIVVGTEVAKEGIIQYSQRHQVNPDKKEKALNVVAGVSTGSSIASIAVAIGATNPVGAFIGIIGGIVVYNQANKQYEIKKMHDGKVKVLMFIDHPLNPDKAYACE